MNCSLNILTTVGELDTSTSSAYILPYARTTSTTNANLPSFQVMSNGSSYPLKHPQILRTSSELPPVPLTLRSCEKYFGLIKCRAIAPTDLLFPVLPLRHSETGHLLFSLCNKCSQLLDHELDCSHTDPDERGLVGTWTTVEVAEAIKRGTHVCVCVFGSRCTLCCRIRCG